MSYRFDRRRQVLATVLGHLVQQVMRMPTPGKEITLLFAAWCAGALPSLAADSLVIEVPTLAVTLDAKFPRVRSYRTPVGELAGQVAASRVVELNGAPTTCRVTLSRKNAASAVYTLTFPAERIAIELTATVSGDTLDLRMSRIAERGGIRLKTLAFPNNALLSIDSSQNQPALAVCHATNTDDQFQATFRERIAPLSSLAPGDHDTGNYLFFSAGPLAAGIGSSNFTDVHRTAWRITATNSMTVCTAQNPVWEFRKFDDEPVPGELPWVKVFVTPDLNGDGRANWQDAAIVYRRTMPMPLGHESVRDLVGENIAMNFASGAQQPFLKILDEIKKINLATDGLGHQVLIKGFSSEGHDSANTDCTDHWNERAGGLRDLTTLLKHAHDYHARVGIHVNASEAYPEAHRYRPEILRHDAAGGRVAGWTWLDHAHMIDKERDVRSGQLFRALEQMREDLPRLDFIYIDTYWENGWPAAQTARKINGLGLPMYSEGDSCLDPWIVWGHWRGTPHTIQRFLWFSHRDLFANDSILRAGRADSDGFMGWQNQHNFHSFIYRTFSARLPAKFLQHFELLRWVPGEIAEFSDGVRVVKSGDEVTVSRDGRRLMTWTGDGVNARLFVPWHPDTPEKAYVWADAADPTTWALPSAWQTTDRVWLYQLTDQGRTAETAIPVIGGRITLTVPAKTPCVVYPVRAPVPPPIRWGEGGPIQDPGFDSYGFTAWQPIGPARVEADSKGNPRLILPGDATAVSQAISDLTPGRSYAATVWALAAGGRTASLEIDCGGETYTRYVTLCDVRHSAPNDPRTGTNYQRLRVVFTPTGHTSILTLRATPGTGNALVEFDDIRVVETSLSPEAAKHDFWEDFEHIETGGYGPFSGCPGERTHLSESNPPHTADTIHGRFSLKSRDRGRVLRTLPSALRLQPATRYRLTCHTLGQGRITAISAGRTVMKLAFPNRSDGKPAVVTGEFVTGRDTESYLSLFRDGGDFIAIDDLAIDALGPATAAELVTAGTLPLIADEKLDGHRVLLEERFTRPLGEAWTVIPSPHAETSIGIRDGALVIDAYAHTSILAERMLPDGVAAAETRLTVDGDAGQTWGPGLVVLWPGGEQLRVNFRTPDGRFGIDSTAAGQTITGTLSGEAAALRIRFDEQSVIAEARCVGDPGWQSLASFPRTTFPGAPARVRLGKTHAVEGLDDHSELGPMGSVSFRLLRLYQRE